MSVKKKKTFPFLSSTDRAPKEREDMYSEEMAVGPGKSLKQLRLVNMQGEDQQEEYDMMFREMSSL